MPLYEQTNECIAYGKGGSYLTLHQKQLLKAYQLQTYVRVQGYQIKDDLFVALRALYILYYFIYAYIMYIRQ